MRAIIGFIWFGLFFLQFAIYGCVAYVIWHFISKFW